MQILVLMLSILCLSAVCGQTFILWSRQGLAQGFREVVNGNNSQNTGSSSSSSGDGSTAVSSQADIDRAWSTNKYYLYVFAIVLNLIWMILVFFIYRRALAKHGSPLASIGLGGSSAKAVPMTGGSGDDTERGSMARHLAERTGLLRKSKKGSSAKAVSNRRRVDKLSNANRALLVSEQARRIADFDRLNAELAQTRLADVDKVVKSLQEFKGTTEARKDAFRKMNDEKLAAKMKEIEESSLSIKEKLEATREEMQKHQDQLDAINAGFQMEGHVSAEETNRIVKDTLEERFGDEEETALQKLQALQKRSEELQGKKLSSEEYRALVDTERKLELLQKQIDAAKDNQRKVELKAAEKEVIEAKMAQARLGVQLEKVKKEIKEDETRRQEKEKARAREKNMKEEKRKKARKERREAEKKRLERKAQDDYFRELDEWEDENKRLLAEDTKDYETRLEARIDELAASANSNYQTELAKYNAEIQQRRDAKKAHEDWDKRKKAHNISERQKQADRDKEITDWEKAHAGDKEGAERDEDGSLRVKDKDGNWTDGLSKRLKENQGKLDGDPAKLVLNRLQQKPSKYDFKKFDEKEPELPKGKDPNPPTPPDREKFREQAEKEVKRIVRPRRPRPKMRQVKDSDIKSDDGSDAGSDSGEGGDGGDDAEDVSELEKEKESIEEAIKEAQQDVKEKEAQREGVKVKEMVLSEEAIAQARRLAEGEITREGVSEHAKELKDSLAALDDARKSLDAIKTQKTELESQIRAGADATNKAFTEDQRKQVTARLSKLKEQEKQLLKQQEDSAKKVAGITEKAKKNQEGFEAAVDEDAKRQKERLAGNVRVEASTPETSKATTGPERRKSKKAVHAGA